MASILRICRVFLHVDLLIDNSVFRALYIIGGGTTPAVEVDQYGALRAVCDTLLGLATALIEAKLVNELILPILETIELALETAEKCSLLHGRESNESEMIEAAISLSCLCDRVMNNEISGYSYVWSIQSYIWDPR